MSELNKEEVACLYAILNGFTAILAESITKVCIIDVIEASFVDEGTGASAAVSRIYYGNALVKEEVEILTPACDILRILVGFNGGVACKVDGGCLRIIGGVTLALIKANVCIAGLVSTLAALLAYVLTYVTRGVTVALLRASRFFAGGI
jgi:hypothetical protein